MLRQVDIHQPHQKINAKVKDFSLKRLRLRTLDHVHGRTSVRRHIYFSTQAPTGHPGQVKDTA